MPTKACPMRKPMLKSAAGKVLKTGRNAKNKSVGYTADINVVKRFNSQIRWAHQHPDCKGRQELLDAEEEYNKFGYCNLDGRVKFIHNFNSRRAAWKDAATPSSSLSPVPTMVPYKPVGFGARGKSGQTVMTETIPLLGLRAPVHLVTRPGRGQAGLLPQLLRHLLEHCAASKLIYVSASEHCPLRPMVLVYGEDKSTETLREDFQLDEADVFVLGNSAPDTSSVVAPFAVQYIWGLSDKYTALHLLPSPFTPNVSQPWGARPHVCAFLSMRAEGRSRDQRVDFVRKFSESLQASSCQAKVCSLGKVEVAECTQKNKWFKKIERDQTGTYYDKAIGVYAHFKFVVAFENNPKQEGYVTEKLFMVQWGGCMIN